jgi:uncharacterized membrane protein HdeD (DUF308 family)
MAAPTRDPLLAETRSLLITGGIISIIVGIVLLAWPEATVVVVAVLLAVNLILLGILVLAGSLGAEISVGQKILGSFLGLLAILAGVVVLGRPLQTVGVIVVVVGAFWVVGGVLEFLHAIFGEVSGSRLLAMFLGVLSIGFGVVALSWPGPTVAVVIWLIGIWSLVSGLIRALLGFLTPKSLA